MESTNVHKDDFLFLNKHQNIHSISNSQFTFSGDCKMCKRKCVVQ